MRFLAIVTVLALTFSSCSSECVYTYEWTFQTSHGETGSSETKVLIETFYKDDAKKNKAEREALRYLFEGEKAQTITLVGEPKLIDELCDF